MTSSRATVQEIKGNLAKLLATENLIVEHRVCETAQFNVERRVLTLPIWVNLSNTVYDMLVGHEVGHALFTPPEDPKMEAPRSYLNVTEDARIEKLMKRKFPGLNKYFYNGYHELMARDFFELEGIDVQELNLIDRINLWFKGNKDIEFTDEEQKYISMTDVLETFEDAIKCAESIWEFSKLEREKRKQEQKEENISSPDGRPDLGQDSTEYEGEGEEEETEQGSGEDDFEDGRGSNNVNLEDMMDIADNIEDVLTDENLQEKLKEHAKKHGLDPTYTEVPDINLDTVIVPNKEVWDINAEYCDGYKDDYISEMRSEYNEFKKSAQKEVNYLVKEFECRKSASAYSRATTSRTGVLDTTKLHTYRYNEDLFKKITNIPEGKNHGLIFVLDWSGSMSHVLQDTVKQLLNLVWFCRKVQIPFDVYAFTQEWFRQDHTGAMYTGFDHSRYYESPHQEPHQGDLIVDKTFNLLNFLTSKTRSKDFEEQCFQLWYLSKNPRGKLSLSGTPLNEAIVCLHKIIPQFKKQNGVEKVNVTILTDGESSSIPSYKWQDNDYFDEAYWGSQSCRVGTVIRNPKNGRTYTVGEEYTSFTTSLLEHLQDCFPEISLIGIRLLGSSEFRRFLGQHYTTTEEFDRKTAEWKKTKSTYLDNAGYQKYFALNSKTLSNDSEFEVQEDATKAQIRSAFRKSLTSKKLNKKVLCQFVELVA
tara:strand:- start:3327 stop:5435 length:2109 start_codon:yes stop_codon:yes gene_type:complete